MSEGTVAMMLLFLALGPPQGKPEASRAAYVASGMERVVTGAEERLPSSVRVAARDVGVVATGLINHQITFVWSW